jgi:hypothetical protein
MILMIFSLDLNDDKGAFKENENGKDTNKFNNLRLRKINTLKEKGNA